MADVRKVTDSELDNVCGGSGGTGNNMIEVRKFIMAAATEKIILMAQGTQMLNFYMGPMRHEGDIPTLCERVMREGLISNGTYNSLLQYYHGRHGEV